MPETIQQSVGPNRFRNGMLILLLAAVTLTAYWPSMHGEFLWDDDTHISENQTLRSVQGLHDIWFQPGATCQYYPLTFTGFWLGHQLWGFNTFGYHLTNVLMHILVAVLFWQLLKYLNVRGAWLAAMIFALHPVCVMSVAWMTELKNTLSAALALGAGLAYLRFAGIGAGEAQSTTPPRAHWPFAVLSLGLFLSAMFAKTAVSFLPATLLLILWWKRGRIAWRLTWPLMAMLGIVAGMGLLTIRVEHLHGTATSEFQVSFLDRILVSGRSFWFYLAKLLFPWPLSFIYERWKINPGTAWQYGFPLATMTLLTTLWMLRHRIGKAPLVAALHFFTTTSLLILIQVLYMMRYSYVSDHWQYYGCMSIIALAAAGMTLGWNRLTGIRDHQVMNTAGPTGGRRYGRLTVCATSALLLGLGFLTWKQNGIYSDSETLWRNTLQKNPTCWLAHNNLGHDQLDRGEVDAAIAHFRQAIALQPDDPMSYFGLGNALRQKGELEEAMAGFEKGLSIQPDNEEAHEILGVILLQRGQPEQAATHFRQAVALEPNNGEAHSNLGIALFQIGLADEAIIQLQKALELRPNFADAHYNFGVVLKQIGRVDEAIDHLSRALELHPGDIAVHNDLGVALQKKGKAREAIAHFETALKLQPENPVTCKNLAWILATSPQAEIRDGARAVQLSETAVRISGDNDLTFLGTLAASYAEAGRFTDAVTVGEKALKTATAQNNLSVVEAIRRRMDLYAAGSPFRDTNQVVAARTP